MTISIYHYYVLFVPWTLRNVNCSSDSSYAKLLFLLITFHNISSHRSQKFLDKSTIKKNIQLQWSHFLLFSSTSPPKNQKLCRHNESYNQFMGEIRVGNWCNQPRKFIHLFQEVLTPYNWDLGSRLSLVELSWRSIGWLF